MAKDAHKKPVLLTTSPESVGNNNPRLNRLDFDQAIYANSYAATIEKAVKCPCKAKADGKALVSCGNCGGSGWFFYNKKRTDVVIQSINKETKFLPWTEVDKGTVQITARGDDRVGFMDRISLIEADAIFSQVVTINQLKNTYFSFLFYQPIMVEDVFLFTGAENKHKFLVGGADYTILENRIVFASRVLKKNLAEMRAVLRYRHVPVYNVIDIPRDYMKIDEKKCGKTEQQDMPPNYIARKAHFMLDEPNFEGESLFDNSHTNNPYIIT